MKQQKSSDPIHVGLLRSLGVMMEPEHLTALVEELKLGIGHEQLPSTDRRLRLRRNLPFGKLLRRGLRAVLGFCCTNWFVKAHGNEQIMRWTKSFGKRQLLLVDWIRQQICCSSIIGLKNCNHYGSNTSFDFL
jgi:hypothetical protein